MNAVTDALSRAEWGPEEYLTGALSPTGKSPASEGARLANAVRMMAADVWALEHGRPLPEDIGTKLMKAARGLAGRVDDLTAVRMAARLPDLHARHIEAAREATSTVPRYAATDTAAVEGWVLLAEGRRADDVLAAVSAAGREHSQYVGTAWDKLAARGPHPDDALEEALELLRADDVATVVSVSDQALLRSALDVLRNGHSEAA